MVDPHPIGRNHLDLFGTVPKYEGEKGYKGFRCWVLQWGFCSTEVVLEGSALVQTAESQEVQRWFLRGTSPVWHSPRRDTSTSDRGGAESPSHSACLCSNPQRFQGAAVSDFSDVRLWLLSSPWRDVEDGHKSVSDLPYATPPDPTQLQCFGRRSAKVSRDRRQTCREETEQTSSMSLIWHQLCSLPFSHCSPAHAEHFLRVMDAERENIF